VIEAATNRLPISASIA